MTTRIIVSIPYIQSGNEVVIETISDTRDDSISRLSHEDILRKESVREYNIWDTQYLNIYERKIKE